MATNENWQAPDGYKTIFRPWIKLKDGRILYAKAFGKKAWPIRVPDTKTERESPQ